MGNGVSTDSIRASKIAEAEKKIQARQKKEQEALDKQKAAAELVNNISGTSKGTTAKSIKKDVTKDLEKQLKDKKITEEQYKEAKAYVKSDAWDDNKTIELNSAARIKVAGLAAKVEGESIGDIKGNVKDTLNEQLKNKEITQDEYDKATEYTKTGTWVGRLFGKKEKDSRKLFRTEAHKNHKEEVKKDGPEFDVKLQAKLNVAKIDTAGVYNIGDKNGGAADANYNYSKKSVQPGELDAAVAEFNQNSQGVEFTKKEVKNILKQAGYHVENKIEVGKLSEDMLRGGLIGAPGSYISIGQSSKVAADMVGVTASQSMKFLGVLPAVTTVAAGVTSAIMQANRVEKRAIPSNVPEGVTTYDQYAKYLDKEYATTSGATIGKDIAKFYTDKKGNLIIDQMNKDLKRAAGTEKSVATPLNYEEALGLLADLSSGKIKVEQPVEKPETKKEPEKKTCDVVKTQDVQEKTVNEKTESYTPKKGEYWSIILAAKYPTATQSELNEIVTFYKTKYCPKGMKPTDGFQPGKMDLLEEYPINGKIIKLDINGVVDESKKNSGPSNVKTTKAATNLFTKKVVDTTYGYKSTCGKDVNGLSQEARDKQIEEFKKAHPELQINVK